MHISHPGIFSKLSIVLSSACIIHCLSFPIIILLLPALAQFFSSTFETILVLSIIPLSAIGFLPTWRKHKNMRYLYIYLGSLILMLVGQFAFTHSHDMVSANFASMEHLAEIFLITLGAIGLAWVIYKNNKHTHVCKNPHHHH
ncbi:MAG: MerC domain-containing protein [Balneolia bacterium]|nr:MerC domain-containing protein [Balneolia bacterium]